MTLPLALNRLYISAPGSWLDERQSDALRRLNEDQDFSMMNLGGRSGDFIRVTHPHISNAVYEAVRELGDPIVRARDLHRAFAKSMRSAEYATARLILVRVADNHERLAPLDADELACGMTRAWVTSTAEAPVVGPDLAGFWTSWAVWNSRQPLVSKLLGEQPLERAREALRQGHTHWAALWRSLWKAATGHAGLVSDAEGWLKSDAGLQSLHWSGAWEELFAWQTTGNVPSSLAEAAADWLRKNEFEPDWNFVFRPLAKKFPDRTPWASALHLLDALPSNRNWPYVFQAVADNAAAVGPDAWRRILLRGWDWLDREQTRETPEWSYVWRKLAESRGELPEKAARALPVLGDEWLRGHEENDNWSFVWQKLIELRAELPEKSRQELPPVGYEWLKGREDLGAWAYVWQKLVEMRAELPEKAVQGLLPLGYEWLKGREDHDSWNFIWRRLVEVQAQLPAQTAQELLPLGYEWLRGREDRVEWAHVWRELVELRAELPKEARHGLLALGDQWLKRREDRDEWAFIWQTLVELRAELSTEARQGLLALGHQWLKAREDRDEWSFIWRKLVDLRAELPKEAEQELLLLGYAQLRGREDRDDWSFVWQKLVDLRAGLPPKTELTLNELCWGWLARPGNADRGEWDKLWEACFKDGYREVTFLAAGSDWVLKHLTLPQGYGLAANLLSVAGENWTPPKELIAFCRNWLSTNTRHPSWTFVFKPLWALDPSKGTASLVPLWLDANPPVRAVFWVVNQLLRARNTEIVLMLKKWTDAHPDSAQSSAIRAVVDQYKKASARPAAKPPQPL